MGAFDPFLTDPEVLAIVRARGHGPAVVASLREHAKGMLQSAIQRVPRDTARVVETYRSKGIELAWDLDRDDDAIVFCLALPACGPSATESRAAALLRACVAAKEAGEVTPLADMQQGEAMRRGRKPGSGGPVRAAIALALKKSPALKNPDIWKALAAKPPKGWTFFAPPGRGRYIEGPGAPASDNMTIGRFWTICGEERKKLKV